MFNFKTQNCELCDHPTLGPFRRLFASIGFPVKCSNCGAHYKASRQLDDSRSYLLLDLIMDAFHFLYVVGLLFVIFYYKLWFLTIFLIVPPPVFLRMISNPLVLDKKNPRNRIIERIQEKKKGGEKEPLDQDSIT